MYKPMRAVDVVIEKLRYPVIVQPKIDGVRGVNFHLRGLTGRSLKPFRNRYTTDIYSAWQYRGLDGEMVLGAITDDDLCRRTTSAIGTIEGEPDIKMVAFDLVNNHTIDFDYMSRYECLRQHIEALTSHFNIFNVSLIETKIAINQEELEEIEAYYLALGFEGIIIRNPCAKYKQGNATVKNFELLRLKRFIEENAIVLDIIEGRHNANESIINELGYISRSTVSENMIPNGKIGSLICRCEKTGKEIEVSAGKLTDEQRKYYYENPSKIINQVIKYKHFPKGVKDKPRFPTFQAFRLKEDI